MRANVKRVMEMLDTEFSRLMPEEQRDLWDLLTALRGPDNEDYELKSATTTHLRAALLPESALGIDSAAHAEIANHGAKAATDHLRQFVVLDPVINQPDTWETCMRIRHRLRNLHSDVEVPMHFAQHMAVAICALVREEQ